MIDCLIEWHKSVIVDYLSYNFPTIFFEDSPKIWTNDHSSQLYINYISCIKCITTPPCEHYGLSPNKYTFNPVTKKKDREKINAFYI